MRKAHKKMALDMIASFDEAHGEIRRYIEEKKLQQAMDLLVQCQEGAVKLGEFIDDMEGAGTETVSLIETYCERIYQVYEDLYSSRIFNVNNSYKRFRKLLIRIENSIRNDIKTRLEIAFLPYKASMWDSLESVWMAADADPDCDAYVVPIPYYRRNEDGSLGEYHYEGKQFPEYVPVIFYEDYLLKERQPDIIYIHNPYDQGNHVTSVDPRYYSAELKKYSTTLVYIPYYITSGGMSEGQSLCLGYLNADYIIVQAEKYRKYFDSMISQEKLLPLGSPKADRIIRLCQNPPEPPAGWKEKMAGRKVYFYNTSISGMLSNTRKFLLKMEYVFKCFQGREDACLLWRPHPLLESTFDSMRKEYKPFYEQLKRIFIANKGWIYDDTPDIEMTIANSDAYIGDEGSSVTAMFGLAGKPLFILKNAIHTLPQEDDWRGEIIRGFAVDGKDEWMITQGNRLYHSPENDHHYEWYCDLSEFAYGNYYLGVFEILGRVYACPVNAQAILVIEEHKVVKKIPLKEATEKARAFYNAGRVGEYLFLIPLNYHAIVRYDTQRDQVDYIEGYKELFVQNVQGEWRNGGGITWKNYVLLASPTDNRVLFIDAETMQVQVLTTGGKSTCGCSVIVAERDEIWLLPYVGRTVTRWNPETGFVKEYTDMPEGFQCMDKSRDIMVEEKPFGWGVSYQGKFILSPLRGNMFVEIDKETGEVKEWKLPFEVPFGESGYFPANSVELIFKTDRSEENIYRLWHGAECRLYDFNMETGAAWEIEIIFDRDELRKHEAGFSEDSDWLAYACRENAMNSLPDFLNDGICGSLFDRERQLAAYRNMTANNDGSCGEKIHQTICAACMKG